MLPKPVLPTPHRLKPGLQSGTRATRPLPQFGVPPLGGEPSNHPSRYILPSPLLPTSHRLKPGLQTGARAARPQVPLPHHRLLVLTQARPLEHTTSMNTKPVCLLLAFLAILITTPVRAADDETLQNPALKRFYTELQTLFRKHYPKATSHRLKDKIHFEHDTRVFLVHEPLMTGEWQDPRERRGPKLGGILCDITLQKGPYQGQAVVPQTFDLRYFTILLLSPYSPKQDAHLTVHLSYPRNVTEEFLKQFAELATDFSKYVD